MRKNPFLLFILVITIAVVSAISLIQSRRFADFAKGTLSSFLPSNFGVKGNFSHFELQFFPPGVAISNPSMEVIGPNPAGLPEGTEVKAQRLELTFRSLQVLSGRIRIHEVKVVDGSLKTKILGGDEKTNKAKKLPKSKLEISWQDLFQVRAEKLTLQNTTVDLSLPDQKVVALFMAKEVSLFQTKRGQVDTYQLDLNVSDFKLSHAYDLPFPSEADGITLSAQVDSAGIFLKQFRLEKRDTFIECSGSLLGDVLKPSGLKFDAEMKMKGDLQTVFNPLSKEDRPTGVFQFEGKVTTEDIEKWRKNIFAKGKLSAGQLRWRAVEADALDVEGSFDAKTEELKVSRARVETKKRPKVGPNQLGSGGEIHIGAFETRLGSGKPIQVSVQMVNAHLNWLFSPIIKNLYALDGAATGKSEITLTPGSDDEPFLIQGDVDWKLDYLQLDNQKYGKTKPLSKIFIIPNLKIKGKVTVSEEELFFNQMQAEVVESRFIVDGSIRLGEEDTAFDLRGGGPIDFSEVKELIGLPSKGKGQVSIHVHGPSEKVVMDFDSDIRDFEFIHLKFGDFRGRISYLDATSQLRLQKLDCNKGSTRYSVDGQFEFSEKNKMELDANIPTGDLREFLSIFSDITKDFWWFPESLGGSFQGNIQLRGGVALSEMVIRSKIIGESWDFYSERLQKASLDFGYDKGKYSISNFRGFKRRGLILGDLSFSEKDGIQWKVLTNEFLLTDFDHLSRLKIPMRGNWSFTSEGQGKFPNIQSLTLMSLSETTFRGREYPRSDLTLQTADGKATLGANLFGNQARMSGIYDFQDGKPSSIQVDADQLDFAPAILVLNPNLVKDESLEGKVSGSYLLNFLTGKSELGSGKAELREYVLRKSNTRFKNQETVQVKIDRGSFDLPSMSLVGDEGKLNLALRSQEGSVSGRLRGTIDLGIVEFLTSAIQTAEGLMDLDLRFSGSVKDLQASGSGQLLPGGVIRLPSMDNPIEEIQGEWVFKNGLLDVRSLRGDFAAGKIGASGTVQLFTSKVPKLDLGITLSENRVKVYPFQFAKTQGNLKVQGDSIPYFISGRLVVDQALSREKIANTRSPGFRTSRYSPDENSSSSLDRPLFQLGIDVSAPGKILVQNELMDLEAKGEVKIVNTLELPRVVGKAQAVQGKILFKDRSFQIQSGWMEFDSPTVLNPRFEMIGNAEVANRKIQMYASGRLDKYRIEFTSNPPMKENEILTLLALGVANNDARGVGTVDRSAYQQGEAASLVLHSLDFNREVKNKTGFQIGVDQAVDTTIGQSIFRPRLSDTEPTSTPKVVIRREFGKRFGILAGSTVGVGTNIQREFNAEMKVTPGFSVLGVWDTYEGANSDEARRNSYGFDLKLQKRFK
jgi:hypothetical protein